MIEPDRRDCCSERREHFVRVAATTQTCLDHCDIDFLPCEPVERQSRRHLKKAGANLHSRRNPLPEKLEHLLFGHRFAVYSDSLAEIHQVRRRISTHLEATRTKERFARGDDTSLPVGAGNVNRRELAMRRAEFSEEG